MGYLSEVFFTFFAKLGLEKYVVPVAESTSGDAKNIQCDDEGAVKVAVTGASSLPTGAATAARQDTGNAALASILAQVSAAATQTSLASLLSVSRDMATEASLASLLSEARMAPAAEDNTNGVYAVVSKPLAVEAYCWSVNQSAALEASSVAKATPGVLHSWDGRIDSTAPSGTYYVQFINAASLPADGAVTHLRTPVKAQHVAGDDTTIAVEAMDLYASTGIVVCLSSTEFTKTISGAYLSATCLYK